MELPGWPAVQTLLQLLLVDSASSGTTTQHRSTWSSALYDAVLQGLLDAIDRLDLTYTALGGGADEGEEGEGACLVPCTPSDMHAFLNLVQLATKLLPVCGAQLFR